MSQIQKRVVWVRGFFREGLWSEQRDSNWLLARAVSLLQFAVMTAEGFVRDQLLLQAGALSYFTVLSLIPIIAIVIAIAASIGIDSSFAEQIVEKIAAGAPEAQERILAQVRSADFKALGSLGAGVVFLTTIFGISNVERSFNAIWGVKESRSWARRFPDYLAVLVLIPLLATSLSLATGLKSEWLVGQLFQFDAFVSLYEVGLRLLPWLVLSMVFTLMFSFLPNTRVRFRSALLGGVVSGGLVLQAQDAYIGYSVGVARADALFGAFAQLPLLFAWIYIFWAILLFGAELSFAHQNLASYRRELQGATTSAAERGSIALRISIHTARAFREAAPAPTAENLADNLCAPIRTVRGVLEDLEAAGILALRGGDGDVEAYQLGQPAERIRVMDVLAAVQGERGPVNADDAAPLVERVLAKLESAGLSNGAEQSLEDLLRDLPGTSENSGLRLAASAPASLDPSGAPG
jgi:membrane protein